MEWKNIFDNVPVIPNEEVIIKEEYDCFIKLIEKIIPISENPTEDQKVDIANQEKFLGNNSIATIRNRPFRIDERNKIKETTHWKSITQILEELVSLSKDDELYNKYKKLETYIKDNIKNNDSTPRAATLKLAASVLPNYLTTIASSSDISDLLKYLKEKELITKENYKEINEKTPFEKSHFLLQRIKEEY